MGRNGRNTPCRAGFLPLRLKLCLALSFFQFRVMQLRVASYNVHKCVGTDRKRDPARTLAAICAMDADIIALQEADRRFGARHAALPLDMIEADSPYRPVAFHIRPFGLGWHGNAVLIRKEFTALSARALTLPMLEPRGAVMADIDVGGPVLRVLGTHLDLTGMWRRRQIRSMLLHLDQAAPYRPNVMMGDFNQWSNRGALSEFAFHRHRLANLPASFPAGRPMAKLDRIILSHEIEMTGGGAHICEHSRIASDHLPVYADIII